MGPHLPSLLSLAVLFLAVLTAVFQVLALETCPSGMICWEADGKISWEGDNSSCFFRGGSYEEPSCTCSDGTQCRSTWLSDLPACNTPCLGMARPFFRVRCPSEFLCPVPGATATATMVCPKTYCPGAERPVPVSCRIRAFDSPWYEYHGLSKELGDFFRQCAMGFYCEQTRDAQPKLCPAGSWCPMAATAPQPCSAGYFCEAGSTSSTAKLCQAGSWCPEGSSSAMLCPAGSWCPAGATALNPCSAGKYCPAGSLSESACPAGSYCQTPSIAPRTCPADSFCVENSTEPMQCAPKFVSQRGSTKAEDCWLLCGQGECSKYSLGCSPSGACECLDGFSGDSCSDFLFPDMAAANPCIVQGFDMCAVDTLLVSKTISADDGRDFGLHCNCFENKDSAGAGVIPFDQGARFKYDPAAQAFRITTPGCGSGPYRLCASSDIPSGVKWLRENLTASAGASMSCTWDIVPTGVVDVQLRAATPELRGAVLGTDFIVWPPWVSSSGVVTYAPLTTRKAPSDQALWSVKSLSSRLDSYCSSRLSSDLSQCPCGMSWDLSVSRCVAGGPDSTVPNATCMPGAIEMGGDSCMWAPRGNVGANIVEGILMCTAAGGTLAGANSEDEVVAFSRVLSEARLSSAWLGLDMAAMLKFGKEAPLAQLDLSRFRYGARWDDGRSVAFLPSGEAWSRAPAIENGTIACPVLNLVDGARVGTLGSVGCGAMAGVVCRVPRNYPACPAGKLFDALTGLCVAPSLENATCGDGTLLTAAWPGQSPRCGSFNNKAATFSAALASCAAKGGVLASMLSREDERAFAQLAKSASQSAGKAWIGLRGNGSSWLSGYDVVARPSPVTATASCVTLVWDASGTRWESAPCERSEPASFCEFPPSVCDARRTHAVVDAALGRTVCVDNNSGGGPLTFMTRDAACAAVGLHSDNEEWVRRGAALAESVALCVEGSSDPRAVRLAAITDAALEQAFHPGGRARPETGLDGLSRAQLDAASPVFHYSAVRAQLGGQVVAGPGLATYRAAPLTSNTQAFLDANLPSRQGPLWLCRRAPCPCDSARAAPEAGCEPLRGSSSIALLELALAHARCALVPQAASRERLGSLIPPEIFISHALFCVRSTSTSGAAEADAVVAALLEIVDVAQLVQERRPDGGSHLAAVVDNAKRVLDRAVLAPALAAALVDVPGASLGQLSKRLNMFAEWTHKQAQVGLDVQLAVEIKSAIAELGEKLEKRMVDLANMTSAGVLDALAQIAEQSAQGFAAVQVSFGNNALATKASLERDLQASSQRLTELNLRASGERDKIESMLTSLNGALDRLANGTFWVFNVTASYQRVKGEYDANREKLKNLGTVKFLRALKQVGQAAAMIAMAAVTGGPGAAIAAGAATLAGRRQLNKQSWWGLGMSYIRGTSPSSSSSPPSSASVPVSTIPAPVLTNGPTNEELCRKITLVETNINTNINKLNDDVNAKFGALMGDGTKPGLLERTIEKAVEPKGIVDGFVARNLRNTYASVTLAGAALGLPATILGFHSFRKSNEDLPGTPDDSCDKDFTYFRCDSARGQNDVFFISCCSAYTVKGGSQLNGNQGGLKRAVCHLPDPGKGYTCDLTDSAYDTSFIYYPDDMQDPPPRKPASTPTTSAPTQKPVSTPTTSAPPTLRKCDHETDKIKVRLRDGDMFAIACCSGAEKMCSDKDFEGNLKKRFAPPDIKKRVLKEPEGAARPSCCKKVDPVSCAMRMLLRFRPLTRLSAPIARQQRSQLGKPSEK
jgi:hypothetical protein